MKAYLINDIRELIEEKNPKTRIDSNYIQILLERKKDISARRRVVYNHLEKLSEEGLLRKDGKKFIVKDNSSILDRIRGFFSS